MGFNLYDRVEVTSGPFEKWMGTVVSVTPHTYSATPWLAWCGVKLDGLQHTSSFLFAELRMIGGD